jgi:uncharacterized protein (TIGR02246 family)
MTHELIIQPEYVRELVRQAADALMSGDAYAFAALFTPNGEFIVPGQKWVGREAIHQAIADFSRSYSHVTIEIRQIVTEGNHTVVEWQWQDMEKANGRRSQADDAIAIDFTGKRISRWREYIDAETPKHE